MLLSFPLSHPGGVSSFVRGLLEALAQSFEVDLVLIAPDQFRAGPGERRAQARLAVEQFFQLLRLRPEVVHTHEHFVHLIAAVLYQQVARRSARIVHTVHIDPVERRSRWKRLLLGWLMGRCDVVTAVSADTLSRLGNIAAPLPRRRRVVRGGASIPLRAPHDPLVADFRRRFGLHEGPVICQVGPLNFALKVAGFQRLVRSLPRVRAHFPDAQLLLVGDGRLREQLERTRSELGLQDAVIITGYLQDVSIPLAVADVYCQITSQDACPISLLEAMLSGKPIVASHTGGIPEIVTDGRDGLLVADAEVDVADAIIRLLEHPDEARALGARARETALANFTWARVADEFADLYGIDSRRVVH